MKLKDYLFLPAEITPFERAHLARTHSVAWWFFVAHVPVLTLIAAFNGTQPLLIAALSGLTLLGPVLAKRAITNPRHMSAVYGITAMAMGAILVTAGRGPMTIEMHFYFFVLLALLSVFGDPMAVITAAVTVALHHLALWALYPQAIFNYDAPVWAVLVHALFVVLESVGAVYVARSFFDNVIGLDRIVQARTAALASRYVLRDGAAWCDVGDEAPRGFDKTDLLLRGQRLATVAVVLDAQNVTLAAPFDSGMNFLTLLGIDGGMPTVVSVPRSRADDVRAALRRAAKGLPPEGERG